MKQMARRYVWWPKINSDIKSMVQRCSTCRTVAKAPDQKYQLWPKTEKSWERIHLDYAGPFFGKMWFICVDAHSKYPYVIMQNVGQQIFANEGLPDTIVTDNNTQFTSQEFQRFCIQHQIKPLTSPVFHPASNSEAERFVQTFENGLNKNCEEGRDLIGAIRVVLASYCTSLHPCLNWRTPAEVLHGRQPKCLLSLFLLHKK